MIKRGGCQLVLWDLFRNLSHPTVWTYHVIQRMKLSVFHVPLDFVVATDVQGSIASWTVQLKEIQRVIRNSIGIYIAINRRFFKTRTGKQPSREEQARKNVSFGHYGPRSSTTQSNMNAPANQAQGTIPPFGRGRGTVSPSWMSSANLMHTPSSLILPPPLLPP